MPDTSKCNLHDRRPSAGKTSIRTISKNNKPRQSRRKILLYLMLMFILSCAWVNDLLRKIPFDVILVIDKSESMAWGNPIGSGKPALEDPANPAYCNLDDSCEPFRDVKAAAAAFAATILNKSVTDEMDRLSVVTFATGWQAGSLGTVVQLNWTKDSALAREAIQHLQVYDPGVICPFGQWGCPDGPSCPADLYDIPAGACLYYGDSDPSGKYPYLGMSCPRTMEIDTADGEHWTSQPEAISACTTSNLGGGLSFAGRQLSVEARPEAQPVVILLTDGAANASFGLASDIGSIGIEPAFPPIDPVTILDYLPLGFCPDGTWQSSDITGTKRIYCQDGDAETHHDLLDPAYDADDFARDQGRFVACDPRNPAPSCRGLRGQGAILITIGLGNEILALDADPNPGDRKPYGGSLLRYLAALGDDGDADTDPCSQVSDYTKNCGNYFYAADESGLDWAFKAVYTRMLNLLVTRRNTLQY
jgi:hypothetical protein